MYNHFIPTCNRFTKYMKIYDSSTTDVLILCIKCIGVNITDKRYVYLYK